LDNCVKADAKTCSVESIEVYEFWLEAGSERWFDQDDAFDRRFRDRFLPLYEVASQGGCAGWLRQPISALSLIVMLDQFPRNCFRGTPRAYDSDPLAREMAAKSIERGQDKALGLDLRGFFYMPFMHSENLADQDRSIDLQRELSWDWRRPAARHRDIVAAFGRFPHRNAILGRVTTAEEQRYLDNGGFTG
jgi:uncharacterized protein (DUF924 family)